jgi:iron complex outermembrane receptor protein
MDNDPGNTFFARIPAYGTVDLKLTHAAGPWRVSATVANLLDNRYYTYAVASAFVPDRYNAYPLPGRTAWVALEYALK